MTQEFIYEVAGREFTDTEAFGTAWKEAKEVAKEEHCGIFRTVVSGDNLRYEFYAKGGCFLNEKFYTDAKLKIF